MNGGDFCVLGFELHNEKSTRNHSRNVAMFTEFVNGLLRSVHAHIHEVHKTGGRS